MVRRDLRARAEAKLTGVTDRKRPTGDWRKLADVAGGHWGG